MNFLLSAMAFLQNKEPAAWVTLFIKLLTSVLVFLFGPWREAYAYFLILMLIDLTSGLWAAGKKNEIKSSTLRQKTKDKFISYALIIMGAFAIERILVSSHLPVDGKGVSAALTFIGTGELISVAENLEAATGRKFKFWEKLLPAAPEKGTKDENQSAPPR